MPGEHVAWRMEYKLENYTSIYKFERRQKERLPFRMEMGIVGLISDASATTDLEYKVHLHSRRARGDKS